MWLPETACNDEVLGLLIDEGLRFVILAPQQATRVRKIDPGILASSESASPVSADNNWQQLPNEQLIPVLPITTSIATDRGDLLRCSFMIPSWRMR